MGTCPAGRIGKLIFSCAPQADALFYNGIYWLALYYVNICLMVNNRHIYLTCTLSNVVV